MTRPSTAPPPHYRWNFITFVVDYVFFSVALSFANPSSVLPAFVSQFTTSAPVIGLVSTVFNGCWLLPQLVAARAINDKPRKKPYLMIGMSGRITFWITALGLWLGLAQRPNVMLTLFFVCLAVFTLSDSLASVAWFDMLARAIPLKRRGRLMGIAQMIGGVAGLGTGVAIALILDSPRFAFPANYALIFTLAGLAFIPSAIALALLRETGTAKIETNRKKWGQTSWLTPALRDATFRRLMASRMLVGMVAMATPFYVVHATDVLHLPRAFVGTFVAAQQVTGAVSGALLGPMSDRRGPGSAIRIGSAIAVAGPLLALVAHTADGGLLIQAYPLVYVALGVLGSTIMLGFYNYLLEIAPDDMRPSYVGLSNTLLGVLTLAPTVGGWLLEATSYTVLFGVTTVLVFLGFLIALRLGPPTQMAVAETEP
jgi:MFS family permease